MRRIGIREADRNPSQARYCQVHLVGLDLICLSARIGSGLLDILLRQVDSEL